MSVRGTTLKEEHDAVAVTDSRYRTIQLMLLGSAVAGTLVIALILLFLGDRLASGEKIGAVLVPVAYLPGNAFLFLKLKSYRAALERARRDALPGERLLADQGVSGASSKLDLIGVASADRLALVPRNPSLPFQVIPLRDIELRDAQSSKGRGVEFGYAGEVFLTASAKGEPSTFNELLRRAPTS